MERFNPNEEIAERDYPLEITLTHTEMQDLVDFAEGKPIDIRYVILNMLEEIQPELYGVKREEKTMVNNTGDYQGHSLGPWKVTAGTVPDSAHRLIVEDCSGNPVCATSSRGVQGRIHIMEANAKLIAAAPKMLEVLRWLDNEMNCREDESGSAVFSHSDFAKVRWAIKLARKRNDNTR